MPGLNKRQTDPMSSETNTETAAAATLPDALPLHRPQLLGLFTGPDSARALLRAANGDTTLAETGQDVPGGTLTHIAEDYVLIRQNNRTIRLSLAA